MSIKIAICDDNQQDIKTLSRALYSYEPSFEIYEYTQGEVFLEDCRNPKNKFDIVFLDIYMPEISGIEIARRICDCMKDTKIIFVSSSNDHYTEAYDIFAFNYMLKPLDTQKLNRVLERAITEIRREYRHKISFSYKGVTYRIFCREILYIESRDKTIYFYMANKTILQCYAKLDDILKQLPGQDFIRCHQSFAVNTFHITEMGENHFRIDHAIISISKKHLKESRDKYFAYLFTHLNRGL